MDVSCERCKAEYEFDDSLLGEHGTTVKCSSCGHVFRVLPQSRHPSRPSLKVRSVASGRVEPLSSLRDLQRRIHEGQVGMDDELGREGFPWRKLADVPELRSFFAKPSQPVEARPGNTQRAPGTAPTLHANATASAAARASRGAASLSVSQSSMPAPPRDQPPNPKRTMLGVGPQNPQIPGPPRMPNLAGGPPPAPRPAANAPGPLSASGTSPQRFGAGAGATSHAASDSDAPTDPPPPGGMSSRPRSVAPLGGTAPVPSNPVSKLYLAEDEAPPARATESSSRIWIIAGVAGVILLGGVVIVGAMGGKSATPEASPVPRVEAVLPKPEAVLDPAAVLPTVAAGTAVEPVKSAKPADKPAAAAAPEPSATEKTGSADARASDARSDREKSGAKEEPKDYGGFVAQGDAALARGDGAAAEKSYQAALVLRASGSEATTGLGYALLNQGKGRESLTHFERAARNGYAEASIGLGDAHKKLGELDAARKAYKGYLERLPDGARAGYAQKQLDAMKGNAAPVADEEAPAPSGADDYRPAGELVAPPPAPAPEPAPAPAAEPAPELDTALEAAP